MPGPLEHAHLAWLRSRGWCSEHVPTSVGRMHVLHRRCPGDLPPVLLIHGFGAAALHWGSLLRRLHPRVGRLIVPDLPAHGFSEVPRAGLTEQTLRTGLAEALEALTDGPAVVVGNSLGGAAAVRYAGLHPDRVSGLLLLSPGGAPMSDDELIQLRQLFSMDSHADAIAFLDRLLASPAWWRHLAAPGLRRTFAAPHMRRWLHDLSHDDFLAPEELSTLDVPVQLLWGSRERILPDAGLSFFEAHLPPHATIRRPDVGHSPHLDNVGVVAEALVDVLTEAARAGRSPAG